MSSADTQTARESMALPRLYAITDLALARTDNHADIVSQLLEGGCRWIQLREKHLPDADLFAQLTRVREICTQKGATLIVNDRVDLAWACGSEGVHLGQEDLPPAAARKVLGPLAMIGRSTHSLAQAVEADADAAVSYVAIGPIFATGTKISGNAPLGLEGVRRVRRRVHKPLVAIGGLDTHRARQVLDEGCDAVAVISALMTAKSIAHETERLITLLAASMR